MELFFIKLLAKNILATFVEKPQSKGPEGNQTPKIKEGDTSGLLRKK